MNIFQFFNITPGNLIVSALTFLACAFAFFLIIREIVTWYWKVNEIVKLLEKIEQNTSKSSTQNVIKTTMQNSQDVPDKDTHTSLVDPKLNVKW